MRERVWKNMETEKSLGNVYWYDVLCDERPEKMFGQVGYSDNWNFNTKGYYIRNSKIFEEGTEG